MKKVIAQASVQLATLALAKQTTALNGGVNIVVQRVLPDAVLARGPQYVLSHIFLFFGRHDQFPA
jgi:hypothetical protein